MPKHAEKLWERQKGESEQAYEAFCIYRDLGLQRSNAAVCERLSKSRQLISRWKARYDWDERARAYDNDLAKKVHAEAVKALKDMTGRHIKMAVQLQEKALEALKELKPAEMTPKDIREFIKMATELERLNRLCAVSTDDVMAEDESTHVDIYLPEKEADDG